LGAESGGEPTRTLQLLARNARVALTPTPRNTCPPEST
jgi:hypothetical protein